MTITQQELKAILRYDEATGIFYWISKVNRKVVAGSKAGCMTKKGYIMIGVNHEQHFAHRLAWLYVHGELPKMFLDHINGEKSDNRICNLRPADHSLNNQNQRAAQPTNKSSGLLGCYFVKAKGKYKAQIHHSGKSSHIGYFKNAEEAHQAYLIAKRELHRGCTI